MQQILRRALAKDGTILFWTIILLQQAISQIPSLALSQQATCPPFEGDADGPKRDLTRVRPNRVDRCEYLLPFLITQPSMTEVSR
jgi:hypothetical protein